MGGVGPGPTERTCACLAGCESERLLKVSRQGGGTRAPTLCFSSGASLGGEHRGVPRVHFGGRSEAPGSELRVAPAAAAGESKDGAWLDRDFQASQHADPYLGGPINDGVTFKGASTKHPQHTPFQTIGTLCVFFCMKK